MKTISKSDAVKLQKQVSEKKVAKYGLDDLGLIEPSKARVMYSEVKKDALKGLKINGVFLADKNDDKPFKAKKPSLAKNRPIGLRYIEKQLELAGFVVAKEFVFAKDRKYRADISVNVFTPKGLQHILIEYEGLVSSKSRHTTITGYTNDCDKYNLATSLGYKVYRYTALNYKNIHDLIKGLV